MTSPPSIADSTSEVREAFRPGGKPTLIAAALMALLMALAWWRLEPPAPLAIDAPTSEFSASRAVEVVQRLIGEGLPHPVGTDEHEQVRKRLESEIRSLGIEPQSHVSYANGHGVGAHVHNVFAELPGPDSGPAIALTAHYDSVDAGPGVADDMAGVAAILEIARALLLDGEQPRRVILLFTDGEEVDLLGAQAFVQEHPLAEDIHVALNFEARGTTGPSLLFETSRDNRWLVQAFGRGSQRPVTGSAFTRVYEEMPNGTDLAEFNAAGWSGANFAFIGGVSRYHTPLDDLDHLDHGSLQHHGDNVLGMVRALSEVDLNTTSEESATFFDLLAFVVVDWTPIGPWMPLVLVALVVLAVLDVRSGAQSVRGLCASALTALLIPVVAVGAGLLVFFGVSLFTPGWGVPFPVDTISFHQIAAALCVGAAFVLQGPLRALARDGDGLDGLWIVWGAGATALQYLEPQVSYVFAFPVVVHVVGRLIGLLLVRRAPTLAAILNSAAGPCAAALVWAPFVFLLPQAIGVSHAAVVVAPWAIVVSTAAALLLRSQHEWGCLMGMLCALTLIGSVTAARGTPFTADHPQGMTIRYHVNPEVGEAHWTAALREPGTLPPNDPSLELWQGGYDQLVPRVRGSRTQVGSVARLEGVFEPPRLLDGKREQTETGFRYTGRLISPRGARVITVLVPNDGRFQHLKVGGKTATPKFELSNELSFTVLTVPRDGIDVELAFTGAARVQVRVIDATPGLPEGDAGTERLERRGDAVPFQRRDATLVESSSQL